MLFNAVKGFDYLSQFDKEIEAFSITASEVSDLQLIAGLRLLDPFELDLF